MAKPPKKPSAAPAPAPIAKKAAKDVVSRAVEASDAKVAGLEVSVQKAASAKPVAPRDVAESPRPAPPEPDAGKSPRKAQGTPKPRMTPETATVATAPVPAVPEARKPDDEHPDARADAVTASEMPGEQVAPMPGATTAPVLAAAPEPPAIAAAPAVEPSKDEAVGVSVPESKPAPAIDPARSTVPAEVEAAPASAQEPPPLEPQVAPAAATAVTDSVRASMASFAGGLAAINAKTLEALHTNTGMTFELIKSLIGVTSVSEAISIHAEHARHRLVAMSEQAREIRALAAKVTAGAATAPRKAAG